MPGSVGDPSPPDAAQRYFARKLGRAARSFPTTSRFIDPTTGGPSAGRQALAADPNWERFNDQRGLPPSPADVAGALDLVGDKRVNAAKAPGGGYQPDEVFSDLLSGDPDYEVVSWGDPWGTTPVKYTSTLGDYYADESTAFLENEGFYDEYGYDYTVNPSGDPTMGRAPSVAEASSVGKWPADITMAPTATKHPERPRTVAAGYDSKRKVMTVIFRDGTLYNYYGVSTLEWGNFARNRSKGEAINKYFNGKVRGPADVSSIPLTHREMLYRVARTAQVRAMGMQKGHSATSVRGKPGGRPAGATKSGTGGRTYRKAKAAIAPSIATTMPPGSSRYTGGST